MRLGWADWLRSRKRDYEAVFQTEVGQRVLTHIASECGYNTDPFVPGDSHQTAYHVGKQWIMLHIRGVMGMSEAQLNELQRQMEERQMDPLSRDSREE